MTTKTKYILHRIFMLLVLTIVMGIEEVCAQSGYWTDEGNYNTSVFSGGTGTEADPYVIATPQDLARLAYMVNSGKRFNGEYFIQRADIDLSAHKWVPIGKDDSNTFLGNYAGQGHKIVGMTIDEKFTDGYPGGNGTAIPGYGLFGSVNGHSGYADNTPVIQNVVLVNPSITIDCATLSKYTRVGLLVGALGNNSTLKNCNVQGGKIMVKNHKGLTEKANMFIGGAVGDCAPGFAGYSTNSVSISIQNISIDADITIGGTNNQGCYQYNVGGIVGRMRYSKGPLVNCYYTGKIDAPQFTISPSYGAIRNTSASGIANAFAGQFYSGEKAGEKVYFGDYQVKYKNEYRTITPDGSGGYLYTPAEAGVSSLIKGTANGLNVWSFGTCPTANASTSMFGAQGVNSCDSYVSSTTSFSYVNLVDAFNSGISGDNIMRYHWSNHDGKLLLERLDEATLTYNSVNNTLTLDFHVPVGATNITYHWRRGAEEIHSGTTDADKTYKLPDHILTDITWHAYASYVIGTKTYYSSVPEYTQVADGTMPTVALTGNKTGNTLTLTTALTDPDNVTTGGVTYHWTRNGVEYSGTTSSLTSLSAFTPEDVEWSVYATFTHVGSEYKTESATYKQTKPQLSVSDVPDGDNIKLTITFDNYGGAISDIQYFWILNQYDSEGNQEDGGIVVETQSEIKLIPAVTFEEKVWHVYAKYRYDSQYYQTASERYLQAATALPTLSVEKVENSGTQQLTMTASLSPDYGTKLTNLKYHWSKNGVEQTDHYNVQRTVPHAFDTQFWRCWATFEHGGKEYRTNDDTYTYYSTLGQLHFTAAKNGSTIVATLEEASSIDSRVSIAYSWADSHGHTGNGNSFNPTGHQDAAWVEFKATITDKNDANNILVKYAYYSFDIEHDVVYINYNTGGTTPGNDANDGRTPQTPVKTWKKAYSLLNGSSWDQNIIVIVNQGASASRMTITEGDTGDKPATITGRWPWVDNEPLKASAVTTAIGRIYMDATTGTSGTRIGAPTRFKDVVFYAMGSSQNRISCFLHDTYFDTGVVMQGFADLEANAGAIVGRKSPHFHLQLYADQLANDNFPQGENDRMTLTIKSGQFGRILASRIAGTKAKNTYIIGRHNNPLKATINIDIKDQNNAIGLASDGTTIEYTDDIGYLASGLTQGMIWGDFQINISGGKIATLVSASQGNALKMGDLKVPVSTFCGRTAINISGDSNDAVVIQNYYGGCQGRVYGSEGVCDAYFYGKSTLNITFGTIESNVFASSAGISGLRSADPAYFEKKWFTPDQRIPYPGSYAFGVDYLPYDKDKQIVIMTTANGETINLSDTEIVFNIKGGLLKQNIYGGSYGNSAPLDNVNYAPAHAGRLFGNTSVNISGGTILGDVYGGGSGSSRYFDMATTDARRKDFLDVAQVYGNTHVNITGNPSIGGNIFGGGAGIAYQSSGAGKVENEFLDIAKVFGDTNVTIDADPAWEFRGNIYGGGAMGAVEGTTTVKILSGTILGNVFGGSKGEPGHADKAKVTGSTKVLIGE